jgi:ferredoxin-type protein NapF
MLAAPRGYDWCWLLPALSPLLATAALIATRVFQLATGLGLLVGLIAVLRRRWFCRWVCPTGLCSEVASRLGRRLGRKPPRLPPVGQWIALVTLAGACLGYPLLLWLDPLAVFAAAFAWTKADAEATARWAAAALPALLVFGLLLPHAWCHRICPLGAMQELLAVLNVGSARRPRASGELDVPERRGNVARRVVLFSGIGLVWAAAVHRLRRAAPTPLRPPGAADEAQFTGVCIRCGNCIRACPAEIVHPDPGEHGIAGWLAPIVRFEEDYCREDCVQCTEACPSGALMPVAAKDKIAASIGFPRVDMDVCLLGDNRDCSACRSHCPFEAIRYRFDEETYTLTPEIDPRRCPGCGACQVACPTQPVKAIVVEPIGAPEGTAESKA